MGDVISVFVAEDTVVSAAIGKRVYFGEILGKHSEVYGSLDKDDLEVLTDDQGFIAKFEHIVGKGIGYNPLDYLREKEVQDDA